MVSCSSPPKETSCPTCCNQKLGAMLKLVKIRSHSESDMMHKKNGNLVLVAMKKGNPIHHEVYYVDSPDRAAFKRFANNIDKALKSFEYSSEWPDLISALGKLNKVSPPELEPHVDHIFETM
ncbi:hypothetical protein M8J75_009546 [Diaphorina citri]|nr:hypothetical protein M8J75_009546 [Diaphorina citri]